VECDCQPAKGVGTKPSGLIGGGRAPLDSMNSESAIRRREPESAPGPSCGPPWVPGAERSDPRAKTALEAIRPCRESQTGWTPMPPQRHRRTRALYELNEHGPALKVFWTRASGLGARTLRPGAGARSGGSEQSIHRRTRIHRPPTIGSSKDLTRTDARSNSDGGQNQEPEGTGNGLVPPVPFGSKVDELL
jgi:hypothetical protein